MAIADLVMPKLGESIMEATILRWHKKPGDTVKQDETVLDIATDKVDSEVPSTTDGILTEILFNVNDVVPVGSVIARLETGERQSQPVPATAMAGTQPAGEGRAEETYHEQVPYIPRVSVPANGSGNNGFYSPLVLNIASSEGISMAELEKLSGSGNEGRVTKKDVLQYVADKKQGKSMPAPSRPAQPVAPEPATPAASEPQRSAPPAAKPGVEIIEMDRMRKLIAAHMVESKQTSAHVTSFTEADVTNMVRWREHNKAAFEKTYGDRLTFTPIFIECILRSIRRYPMINSSVEGNMILVKGYINLGMATALPNGNLIVPVIKNAEQQDLAALAHSVNDLAQRGRSNKLRPDDTQGGTFTLTNVGTFGSLMGTPIINQPQVAILAVGAIKKRPVVLETENGDVIGIRHMMYLSLSYDHRIIDGSLGASFLTDVAREFESWNKDRAV